MYPGGLGPATFTTYAKGYGLDIDLEGARKLRTLWIESFPEMKEHFKPTEDVSSTNREVRYYARDNLAPPYNKLDNVDDLKEALDDLDKTPQEIKDIMFRIPKYMSSTVTGRVKRNCTYSAALNYV